jgi:hypothetical protein
MITSEARAGAGAALGSRDCAELVFAGSPGTPNGEQPGEGVPWVSKRLERDAARITKVTREQGRRAELAELRNELELLCGQLALVRELTGQPLELHLQRWQAIARRYG